MIDHVGFEVLDLPRSARFYDAVFFALGGRRMFERAGIVGWGVNDATFYVTDRAQPAPGYGHVALRASGRSAVEAAHGAGLAAGGRDDGPPGDRPHYGRGYFAAYMRDPDGLRVEIVSRPRR